MLSLIRATTSRAGPLRRTRATLAVQGMYSIHTRAPTATGTKTAAGASTKCRMLLGSHARNTRSGAGAQHLSPRSHFCTSSSPAAAAGAPSSDVGSSSSSASGDATSPAKDTPSNTPVDTPSSGSSRQAASSSTSSARRRIKAQRGSGRITGKASIVAEPTSRVYVPSIPDSFLETHYHPASFNKYNISAIPYHIHESVLNELMNTMASCLLSPNAPEAHIQRMPARHNNVILSSPTEGSSRMLETLTMAAAKKIGADVVIVDMQDLMELTPDIFNSKGTGNPWPVDHMSRGFNPFVAASVPLEFMEDMADASDDDYDDDTDDEDDQEDTGRGASAVFVDSRMFSAKARHGRLGSAPSSSISLREKFEKFWTSLLLAEPALSASSATSSPSLTRTSASPKILYLKDIADIILTPFGSMLLPSLTSAVLTLRKAGHNIMVVAGHSPSLLTVERHNEDGEASNGFRGSADATSVDGESAVNVPLVIVLQKLRSPSEHGRHISQLQFGHISLGSLTYDTFPGPTQSFHHISIPPFLLPTDTLPSASTDVTDLPQPLRYALENAQLFKRDKSDRIKEVNCRNLDSVLRFRGGHLSNLDSPSAIFGSLQGIDSEVWGFGKVYRIISNALGALYLSEMEQNGAATRKTSLSLSHVRSALETSSENAQLRKIIASDLSGKKNVTKPLVRAEDCDRYERKLLGSIVDPEKIKTTFKNTIIPPEVIQTLQTMITLPLVRPELFSYGLLQNEFLSGLLLFGPPGTGKTLLAKAVAKESGARMLEIKASDIFDMYVGEGEKNVSAVFSLARKLSPCVIFLDEVDSIFRARGSGGGGGTGGGGGNSSQREILNQFMVEWDGLRSSGQNQGIVVMASTNRPFELDDAVLRRLPRRILVDLPSEQAREQILNVYLSQEQLEDGVDVKDLAKKTGFFSGSDLKNLCVSAALASVREDVENEVRNLQSKEDGIPSSDASLTSDEDGKPKNNTVLDLSPLLNQYKKQALASATSAGASAAALVSSSSSPKRILKKSHFEKALAQITPSCSENMDSLTELRKWDGLYGDGGKGRRKANKGIGFAVDPSSPTTERAKI